MNGPIAIAVGFFDGVHLGHRALIAEMKKKGRVFLVAFSNQPKSVLASEKTIPCITTNRHKALLLSDMGVDDYLTLPFTQEIAKMPYNLFLEELHSATLFTDIFFGENDAIGNEKKGTPEKIHELGKQIGFTAHYIPKLTADGAAISSSRVREALAAGDLHLALKFLGRPFSAELDPSDPYIEPGLLKQGRYLISPASNSSEQFDINLSANGEIQFIGKKPQTARSEYYLFNSGDR